MNRRLRIAIIGPSPCPSCRSNCCRQNGHDYAVLLRPDEYARFGPFSMMVPIDTEGRTVMERVLPYINGRCQFLGDDLLCTIYEDRPQSCRDFECVKYFNAHGVARHGRFLELNPDVRELLENW